MDVKKHNKKSKGLYVIALLLLVSVLLNGVLFKNIKRQEAITRDEYASLLEEKETELSGLEKDVSDLEYKLTNATPESRENLSKTELEKQQGYLSVANEFINSYLNYDTSSLNERREKLIPITTEDLINQVAPEESNNEEALSSDPTFTSTVTDLKIYQTALNETENTTEVIANVIYTADSMEGKTEVNSFIKLELKTEENGTIKVISYVYYPIN